MVFSSCDRGSSGGNILEDMSVAIQVATRCRKPLGVLGVSGVLLHLA